MQDFRHAVQKAALLRLFEAGPRRSARQLVGLHRRVKSEELRFEIPVAGAFVPQFVGGFDDGLLVQSDGGVAVILQRVYHRQQGRRAVEAGQRVVGGVHDFCAVLHGGHDAADFIAVGVVSVVVYQQIGILLPDGAHQFADAPGRPQSAVILDRQQNIRSGNVQNFAHFPDVKPVGVLRPRRKADGRLEKASRFPDFFVNGDHVGDVV